MPSVNKAGHETYVQRYCSLFPGNLLEACRVGVYEHSGVARDLLVEVLQALGAEVVRLLGRSEAFIPVDTEAIRSEDVELARLWVVEHKLDAVVSTDGDADGPLVSDENGVWLRGDIAGILTAQYLNARAVVTPVSSNTAVELCSAFDQVKRTRIGSPYVIAGMQQAMQDFSNGVVGYEANGGFLQATPITLFDHELSPLPTRDALIVIISVLAQSWEKDISVSELVATLPNRYTHSDRIKAFPNALSRKIIRQLSTGDPGDDAETFSRLFGDYFDDVISVDHTDGVRIAFKNNEIVLFAPPVMRQNYAAIPRLTVQSRLWKSAGYACLSWRDGKVST
ncbi:hypothetical protein [Solemya velesiana gill symbiont]|uniref:Phosphomannomutase n=1 Tax=Solemya velesiana gill symbiont TaxID=1918948 RepID=A0A1T2KN56_9GAMM|nr:hypothetical protein [Solemya velesiana gill symbiont]OOZ34232.1 hypothetical protein BOW51_12265 [Solemya velesiana gill symbiont]